MDEAVVDPGSSTKIYKEECMYCFNNGETPGGVYVCLKSYYGLCPRHLALHHKKTESTVYAHRIRKRTINPEYEKLHKDNGDANVAIGKDGGIQLDTQKYDFSDSWSLAVYPKLLDTPLTDGGVSAKVKRVIDHVIASESAYRLQELESLSGTWDSSFKVVTKHKDLQQLPNPPIIPKGGWVCEVPECGLKDNLWLNLTSGSILCGRKFFDGSGGNNHAIDYYEKNKYPLAVKLGTITPEGADVYSYDEDDMVIDPNLDKHLAHFGVKMTEMEKTEKTMLEMELDLNQKYEWSALTEEGALLENVYGPGYTGLANLGSSCYINASMQTLLLVEDFVDTFVHSVPELFAKTPGNPAENLWLQTAKLLSGLASGEYSLDPQKSDPLLASAFEYGIRPVAFRHLVGKGHPEFSTRRQQDAEEFLRFYFDKTELAARPGKDSPVDAFRFETEERTECDSTKRVAYKRVPDTILALPIPMDAVINKEEVRISQELIEAAKEAKDSSKKAKLEEPVRPKIPFETILERWAAPSEVDYTDGASGAKRTAKRTNRLASFPDYLWVQLQKFTLSEDFTPKKLDIQLLIPDGDIVDLGKFRGQGRQPGEAELPMGDDGGKSLPNVDEQVVSALVDMGFPDAACRKAVHITNNSGLEAATAWVMEHMGDADFAQPHPDFVPKTKTAGPSRELIDQVTQLGFTEQQARAGLKATNNDPNAAAMWLFENPDVSTAEPEPMETESSGSSAKVRDGSGRYKLVGFISHMGSSTSCGHYVCHLNKDGRWVIFNDEKVAYSVNPPKGLGYIYLWKRV